MRNGLTVGGRVQDEANPELQRLRQGLTALATQGLPGLSASALSSSLGPASSDAAVATVTAAAPATVCPRPDY
jgi:hypothetical protein